MCTGLDASTQRKRVLAAYIRDSKLSVQRQLAVRPRVTLIFDVVQVGREGKHMQPGKNGS